MRSRLSLILGLLLAIGAFAALVLLGQVLNPTPYQVTVVVKEVSPGEQLRPDMIATDAQSVNPMVAAEYILAEDVDSWMGATIVDTLHPGQPLLKANLVREDHPRVDRRLSLGLADGDKVAMVIPVNAETAPQNIRAGDRVDMVYGVGRVREQYGVADTPSWVDEELRGPVEPTGIAPDAPAVPADGIALTPTPVSPIDFPFAKVVLQDLEVIAVIHDERPNPGYGGPQSDQPPTLKGDVRALQVLLPRDHAEMMHYGVTTGDYRIALVSPNAPEPANSTLGMTWKDLEAFFWAQRDTALAAITGTVSIDGPGAAALVDRPDLTPMAPMLPMTETTPITPTIPDEAEPETDTGFVLETPAAAPPGSENDLDAAGESDDAPSAPVDLERMVSPSMIQGLVCLGGGLLLAALVVMAGIRVFRNLKRGGD